MLPGLSTRVTIERTALEDLIRPALADTMLALRRALESAAVEPQQLRAIVLIGGSSRIPLVGELVRRAAEDVGPREGERPLQQAVLLQDDARGDEPRPRQQIGKTMGGRAILFEGKHCGQSPLDQGMYLFFWPRFWRAMSST